MKTAKTRKNKKIQQIKIKVTNKQMKRISEMILKKPTNKIPYQKPNKSSPVIKNSQHFSRKTTKPSYPNKEKSKIYKSP